jgi:Metallo-peptidase family M12/IPT/TIG domain/Secretion system C-terminal sorting domain
MKNTPLALATLGLVTALAAVPGVGRAQSARQGAAGLWHDAPAARAALPASVWAGRLNAYRAIAPDQAALAATLASAPLEGTASAGIILHLPTPDGGSARFQVLEAPVMEPALAAQFPDIKTYVGIGLDDPTATLRADLTPRGFHAQVLSRKAGGTFYIDPVDAATPAQGLISYWRQDLRPTASSLNRAACQVVTAPGGGFLGQTPPALAPTGTANRVQTSLGGTLRTYRLALAATGEYTAFTGGTVTSAMAAMTTSVNRVTGVYEKELGVRLVLVANNNLLVFTNASTDPYTNTDGAAMLTQNQTKINAVIGSANYDIGHVFSTGGGGIAGLGVVCGSQKAQGVTGSDSPVADAFDIDYVAHEMGHQFGGNHPFNGSAGSCTGGNRNASTAWEPGSGSTIMAYAGICDGSGTGGTGTSQDLQPHSDAYFHGGNISEMTTFINSTTCAVSASSGNTPPTVNTPVNKSIPANTPFMLTGSATDADGDALTYDWEEMDLGAQGAPIKPTTTQTANSTLPLFRSWSPTASPVRYFPRLADLRNNTYSYGEMLPTVARTMKFRLTVRDQHFSSTLGRIVGGINQSNTLTLTTVNTGAAFAVTAPNTAVTLAGGTATTVTWNVAGTTASPISCATVNILLSTDGGLTFPTTLATGLANSGTASVTLPSVATTTARIMVQAADNYFFDISNANFTIGASTPSNPTITSFTPASGPVGTVVTITGTNFTGATGVTFNTTAATSFSVVSATSITATVPTGATTGTIKVLKTGATTATSATSFTVTTVVTNPTITSFTPATGPVGTVVTITGTNFTGATGVTFNATAATSFSVVSATSITATVPTGATTGTIKVLKTGATTATSATSFTVTTAVAVTRTIANYDFNAGTTYATLVPVTASGVTSTATSTEAFTTFGGTASGTTAFTTNATAGNALAMANSSGTNTRYFQFALGGASLPTYSGYKLYFQPQRSSTGATTITVSYSTNGTTFSPATTVTVGTAFSGFTLDLTGVTPLNGAASVTFRLAASGATGTGTLRIDNFQVQATSNAGRVLGLSADAAATALNAWPNPAHGTLNVQSVTPATTVRLFDLTGREVRQALTDSAGAASLNLNGLPAAIYLLRTGSSTQRVVVE